MLPAVSSSNFSSSMLLNRSARFGSFNAVTSFMAPLTDFSSERSFTSSVALTSLSPLQQDAMSLKMHLSKEVSRSKASSSREVISWPRAPISSMLF